MTAEEFLEEFKKSELIGAQTSGSTGRPKHIVLEKEFMRESARRTNAFFGINHSSRIHSCVAFDYIGGKMTLVRAIEAGCILTFEEPTNHPALRGAIITPAHDCPLASDTMKSSPSQATECPISLLSIVPSQMAWLLAHRDYLPKVENYLIGGSSIPAPIRQTIVNSGVRAWESYGMTETSSHIAVRRVEADDSIPFLTLGGITVTTDERGCLVIIIHAKDRKKREFITNDIAELISDHEFRIIGRYDDVIISGGKKFHPAEAERILGRLTNVPLLFVAKKDDKWGEAIELLAERIPEMTDTEIENDVWKAIDQTLERWQRPKSLRLVDHLPQTPNGKPLRHLQSG